MKLSPLFLGLALPFIPSVASAEILSVKTASANFREHPSDKGAVVFSADKFYPVEVIERKNGWALVRDFEGDKAWVAEQVLSKDQTVVIQGEHANIREKASTDAEVLFKVEHGEVFKVQDRKENWIKVVDSHGDGGWIRSDMTWGIETPESKKSDKSDKSEKSEKSEKSDKTEKSKTDSKSDAGCHCPCKSSDDDTPEKKADLTAKNDKHDKAHLDDKSDADKKSKGASKADSKAKSDDSKGQKPKKPDADDSKKKDGKPQKKAENKKASHHG